MQGGSHCVRPLPRALRSYQPVQAAAPRKLTTGGGRQRQIQHAWQLGPSGTRPPGCCIQGGSRGLGTTLGHCPLCRGSLPWSTQRMGMRPSPPAGHSSAAAGRHVCHSLPHLQAAVCALVARSTRVRGAIWCRGAAFPTPRHAHASAAVRRPGGGIIRSWARRSMLEALMLRQLSHTAGRCGARAVSAVPRSVTC